MTRFLEDVAPTGWGCWRVLGCTAGRVRLCAPSGTLPAAAGGPHRRIVADTWMQECAGGGDGHCPRRRMVDGQSGDPRCVDCREDWELYETEPDRRAAEDDGLTGPTGDPREAGHGMPV